jgi:hypothetical protein
MDIQDWLSYYRGNPLFEKALEEEFRKLFSDQFIDKNKGKILIVASEDDNDYFKKLWMESGALKPVDIAPETGGLQRHFIPNDLNFVILDEYGTYKERITDEDILEWKNDMKNLFSKAIPKTIEEYKLEAELGWQREENKKYHTKESNKDGHHNPFRTHANSHSSKINNRERSRKKRKNKRSHK